MITVKYPDKGKAPYPAIIALNHRLHITSFFSFMLENKGPISLLSSNKTFHKNTGLS